MFWFLKFLLFSLVGRFSSAIDLTVAKTGGNKTSGLQYGIMFEDINHSGDGGLYAELIRNRAFQFAESVDPWSSSSGKLELDASAPLSSALPRSLKVAQGRENDTVTLSNPGWWGIEVRPQTYTGSFYVRGAYNGNFTVSLVSSATGKVFVETSIASKSKASNWTLHTFILKSEAIAPDVENSFQLSFGSAGVANGSLNFNLISLFPPTYRARPNGNRIDLMSLLADLRPRFLRIGGNNIESQNASSLWRWQNTVGPIVDRPGRQGTWGYANTDGLGLAELLDWCEDLDLEPILGVPDGLYLNKDVVSEKDLEPLVQEALNELEYIKGAPTTKYGGLRAAHGRRDPWKLNYVEIGNEDNLNKGESSYTAYRFEAFNKAIKTAFPEVSIVASTLAITLPNGTHADYHQYTSPDKFVKQFNYFDVNATGPSKVLIGEYATTARNGQSTKYPGLNLPYPTWIGSVAEAIFLIGAERNAGAVLGASYAPLFENINDPQWIPDLISFNADTGATAKATSWHTIQLFAETLFTETLPVETESDFGPAYWVAGKNNAESFYGVKFAVYNSTGEAGFSVFLPVPSGTSATLRILTAPEANSQSLPGEEDPVVETFTNLSSGAKGFSFSLPELSVAVLKTERVSL